MRRVVLAIVLSLIGVLTPICELHVAEAMVRSASGSHSPDPAKEPQKPAKELPKKENHKEDSPRKNTRETLLRLELRRPRPANEVLVAQRSALLTRPVQAARPAQDPVEHLRDLRTQPALQVFRN
ncbi:hypothetical protein [Crossiella cryophila]|uniref:Uncharacterized protein n=1 Tax=Crossiella cryophila TaxID=43355 RepID=A0A7W7CFA4_9PSEU|nr:hypothetical protein [Crossiella cryophila]MBB4680040.1 hypothetical protein [Crossiella cryophila]